MQNATSPDNKPTPGWLFHDIVQDVRNSPKDVSDVAEYLMQCVCSDQLNIQLKAVLCIKHLASEDVTFQHYLQQCGGALKVLEDIAAPPIVPQARSLEPQEVKTVRDATQSALTAISTPHTVEKQTEAASLKQRIQGFGNFEPPPEEAETKKAGVAGQVADFVGDSIGDMVDDFREKGAVGALKDATVDALDLVLDGVETVWGWVAGKGDDQPRICQPQQQLPGQAPNAAFAARPLPGAPMPQQFAPPQQNASPMSASNHYAAAFGGGVVGANNPVMLNMPGVTGQPAAAPAPAPAAQPKEVASKPSAPPAAPMVDLLSMDEPVSEPKKQAGTTASTSVDLLGDFGGPPAPSSQAQTTQNMLDF